jgi:hypothetical protein
LKSPCRDPADQKKTKRKINVLKCKQSCLESNLYFDPEPQKTHDKSSKEQIIIQIKEQIIIATKILSLSLKKKLQIISSQN